MEPESQPTLGPDSLFRLAWVFYLLMAAAGVVWIGWQKGTIPLSLFIETESLAEELMFGLLAAAALIGVWELARRFAAGPAANLEEQLSPLVVGLDRAEVVALAVVSGVAEEIFFRGAVQGAWGLIIATILFALLHTGPGTKLSLWTAFAAVAGLVFGVLALSRGTLLAPIVAHATVNAVNLHRLASRAAAQGPSDHPRGDEREE